MPNSAANRPGSGRCLPSAEAHATRFARQREADRTATAQDYVELIADLIDEKGEARGSDVALRLGVANATVVKSLKRLQEAAVKAAHLPDVQKRLKTLGATPTDMDQSQFAAQITAQTQRHKVLLDKAGVKPE
jgi:hypothetical protein